MLFDLENDPEEFDDLGDSPDHAQIIAMMYDRLAKWGRRLSQRTTISDNDIKDMRGESGAKGILLGVVDGSEIPSELLEKYRGKADRRTVTGS